MFKATTMTNPNGRTLIRAEGRLDARGAADVEALVARLPVAASGELDLSGLTSLDGAGCSLLITLRRRGWGLRGASLYVHRLLEEANP